MDKVVHKELSYKINGLLFKTHRELARYKSEKQYGDYFEDLLIKEGMKYVREYRFIDLQDSQGKTRCICDFIIEDKIILEFKTKNFITKEDYYQAKRYLTTLKLQLAVIVNFRQYRLSPKRVLNSDFLKHNSNASNEYSNASNTNYSN
ncbi:GxxExxY protein [Candidatus Parcubacteria bacterium]|nr:GxxExxY protein [Candidatus Parcubacteria bacterium]